MQFVRITSRRTAPLASTARQHESLTWFTSGGARCPASKLNADGTRSDNHITTGREKWLKIPRLSGPMPFGINPRTGRPGPAPHPARDGDRKQARQRINVEVRAGRRPHPNSLSCIDCEHVWSKGELRHEYDHHLGYAPEHHLDVQPVCVDCHAKRGDKARQTHCIHGHKFTADNTFIKSNGARQCRECRREFDRKRSRPAGYWKEVNRRRRGRQNED